MTKAIAGRAAAAAAVLFGALAAPAGATEAGARPAGGAALGEVALATTAATLLTVALVWMGLGHRSGRVAILARAAAAAERRTGLPGWASLPAVVATVSLLTAVLGMYWDIALHIGVGRDEGPLANPAHYLILAGLFGIFTAGFLAMVLPKDRPSTAAVRLGPTWYAPLGGVLICACGAFSLTGFPLDDVWHRLFGQDVTLWGPTHLMLIGGAAMTLVGIAVLSVEGRRAVAATGRAGHERPATRVMLAVALTGGFMLGLSTFQAEFDFGVPQFRLVFAPLLVMLAAGVGLVFARMWGGPGAALGAVGFFLAVRGALTVLVGPVFGETAPRMPLYVVEALVVELVARRLGTDRPLRFALWAGAGIATLGLAAEWAWSYAWMPLPWPAALAPEGIVLGAGGAMAGAVLGGWIGHRLRVATGGPMPTLRAAAVVAAAAVAGMVGYALHKPADDGIRAQVQLTEVRGAPERAVEATIALDPPQAAADAEWLTVTAWQGDGLVVDRLQRVGAGRYRTTRPIPVHGNWKALVRLHRGTSLTAAPIFLPRDEAIPAEEVPAPARFSRAFVPDHTILQREQRASAPWLTAIAYAVVAGIALGLLALLAWGLHRLSRATPAPPARRRPPVDRRPHRAAAPATAPSR